MKGVNTIIKDNSKLTCRIQGLEDKSPARIIIDKKLKIPLNSYIVKTASKYKTIIFFNKKDDKKVKRLKKLKVKLINVDLSDDGNFNLIDILKKIKLFNYSRVFLESGTGLINSFLKYNLIDNIYIFKSNKKIGKNGSGSFRHKINYYLNKKKAYTESVNLFGDKLHLYRVN